MKLLVRCLAFSLSLLSFSCVTQKLRVDEWNGGIPNLDSDPVIQYSKTRQTRFSKIQIVDIGKSVYSSHPKNGKPFQTVDKVGNAVASVVTTDNQTNHYYSLTSYKPVILAVDPATAENFATAQKLQDWSGYMMRFGLAVGGVAAFFTPAVAVLIASYALPTAVGMSGYLNQAALSQFDEIKNKYDIAVNQRNEANRVVSEKVDIKPAATPN
jgi:hypothetical protein